MILAINPAASATPAAPPAAASPPGLAGGHARRLGLLLCAATAVGVVFGATRAARAVIELVTPLANFIDEADEIVVVKVEQLNPDRRTAVLSVVDDLKGKSTIRSFAVNLRGNKAEDSDRLLDRLANDLPLVLFITRLKDRTLVYGYTGGTWLQIIGRRDGERWRWAFTDLEIYLPRTFDSSTAELRRVLVEAIAGRQKPPPPDPKVKPGIGLPPEKAPAAAAEN